MGNAKLHWWLLVCGGPLCFVLVHIGHLPYTTHEGQTGTFFEQFVALPPNEIGDTLAGIFGSLGFLAAVVAILIQATELREQRKATRDMATALQEQKVFFEEESQNRRHEQKHQELDALLRSAIWKIQQSQSENYFVRWLSMPFRINEEGVYSGNATLDEFIIRFSNAVEGVFANLDAVRQGHVDFIDVMFQGEPNIEHLADIIDDLQRADELVPDLHEDQKVRVLALDVSGLIRRLRTIEADANEFCYQYPT